MKTCSRCRQPKDAAEFYADKSKKHGLSSRCKVCHNEQAAAWAAAHPEVRRRIMRDWKARTDIAVFNRKVWLKRAYGLTPEAVDRMLTDQGGECAICGKALKNYHIDHNHTTMVVRGLLCRGCNLGIGFFKESIGRLAAAIQYLEAER